MTDPKQDPRYQLLHDVGFHLGGWHEDAVEGAFDLIDELIEERDTLAAYCREVVDALRQAGEDIHNIGCAGDMYDEPHSPAHRDIMAVLEKSDGVINGSD